MDGYISAEAIQVQCEKCTLAIKMDAKVDANGRSSFFGYEILFKNVHFLSHKGLKCEVKMSFSYDLRWPNLEDRKSVYVNEWLVWGI